MIGLLDFKVCAFLDLVFAWQDTEVGLGLSELAGLVILNYFLDLR